MLRESESFFALHLFFLYFALLCLMSKLLKIEIKLHSSDLKNSEHEKI